MKKRKAKMAHNDKIISLRMRNHIKMAKKLFLTCLYMHEKVPTDWHIRAMQISLQLIEERDKRYT